MDWSIITCCHNSAKRLPAYFEALSRMDLSGLRVELILVDNASRDATAKELEFGAKRLNFPVTIVPEPVPGLMFARCAGVGIARGSWILFLDDDNEPASDYLQQLSRLREKFPEAASYTGNCVLPKEYGVDARLESRLAVLVLRNLRGEFSFQFDHFTMPHNPWGAGLTGEAGIIKEACKVWIGSEKKVVGRTGGGLSGGEDLWLAHYMTAKGQSVVFSDRLTIVHRIDLVRTKANYLARLAFENGAHFEDILAAVRAVKPGLKTPASADWRHWRSALIYLPARILGCLLQPSESRLIAAATTMGLAFGYLLSRSGR